MPSQDLFIAGFHLSEGQNFENYTIDKINMTHNSIVRYNQYEYPYEIHLSWRSSSPPSQNMVDSLKYYLTNYLQGERVIKSYSGRPYKCVFFHTEPQWIVTSDMKSITLQGSGYATRIKESEVSTINQSNAW